MPKGNVRNYKVSEMPHMSAVVELEYPRDKKKGEDIVHVDVKCSQGSKASYFISPENYDLPSWDTGYDIPVLFEKDNISIWVEGSLYVRHIYSKMFNDTFDVGSLHKKASMLMEYKLFTEEQNKDYKDFSETRPTARITYRYYRYLYEQQISSSVLNQKTGVVYDFYDWLSKQPNVEIDMDRVDQTESVFIRYKKAHSTQQKGHAKSRASGKEVTKRSQTVSTPPPAPTPLGYVNDEGENLRPLSKGELDACLDAIDSSEFCTQERLLIKLAIDCGGRKATLLTFRKSTIENMVESKRETDGTYKIPIGRGQLINSKNDKSGFVYVPEQSAERLRNYIGSEEYEERLELYKAQFPLANPKDAYVFLSNRGKPRLIAKSDPYFLQLGHKIKGKYTQDLVAKLKAHKPSSAVPKDFTFHWTRATFARRYYEHMLPLIETAGYTMPQLLERLRARLNHNDVETTNHYLKLFNNQNSLLDAQEKYEDLIFEGID